MIAPKKWMADVNGGEHIEFFETKKAAEDYGKLKLTEWASYYRIAKLDFRPIRYAEGTPSGDIE